MDLVDTKSLHGAHLQSVQGILASLPPREMARAYGIKLADLELVSDNRLWYQVSERRRIKQTLEAVMSGGLDALAVPRIELPAEYIASWICIMVSPVNHQAACAFFDRPRRAADIAAQESLDNHAYEGVSPSRLFALVYLLVSDNPETVDVMRQSVYSAVRGAKVIVTDPEEVGDHAVG